MKSNTSEEFNRICNAAIGAVNVQESIERSINSHQLILFDLFNHLIIEFFNSKTRIEISHEWLHRSV